MTGGFVAVDAADFVNVQAFYTVRDIRTASAALPEGVSEALFIDTGDYERRCLDPPALELAPRPLRAGTDMAKNPT